MANKTISWGDGSGQYVTLSQGGGNGNSTITISSDVNEGKDRTTRVVVRSSDNRIRHTITISQPGKRHNLLCRNASAFLCKDSNEFLVLK